jgi:hypothetical protein
MDVLENISISLATALLTTIGFLYLRIKVYRFFWGPKMRSKGKIKIQKVNTSNKVFVINVKNKTKRWVHPSQSLDRLGHYIGEDVEHLTDDRALDNYKEKNDIDLTY